MFVKEDKGVVRFKIDDFVKLTTKRECKSIEIGNIDWILGAQSETSTRTNDVKHLGVFLTCQNTSRSNLWSCNASIRFSLVKLNSNDKNDAFSMDFEQKFDVNAKILEVPNFKSWEEAICPKNGFIFDPFAVVEAHITIKNVVGIHEKVLKTFEKPDEHLTDVVLIVEGMKVHVGKQ
uniref:MATH domain-containing protein n=1 Tax=Caenorhabditis japonica TaxID=281687 RepID=A0A8R1E1W1_CAEJA